MSDALTTVAALQRHVKQTVLANAAKSKSPAEDIRRELYLAALNLCRLAKVADMQFARTEREMHEEASSFVAFLDEVSRPLDDMFRQILRTASDNVGVGGFSKYEADDLERSHIVTDSLHDNWTGYFELAAIGSECEAPFYQKNYVRVLREVKS